MRKREARHEWQRPRFLPENRGFKPRLRGLKPNAEYRIIPSKHGERHAGAGFMRVGSALSEVVEEGEQGVAGLEPPEALACRRHILKRLFFGFQVRLNVDLCCLRTFVAQP